MKDTRGKRVLVVDDETSITDVTSVYLRQAGFVPDVASDARMAELKIEGHETDLVLLDIHLPGEDGLAFLKRINKIHPELPIIIFTGDGYNEAEMEEAKLNGAVGFISKFMDIETIVATVQRILIPLRT